jgi:hypothetical protein
MLRNDTEGAEAKVLVVQYKGCRQQDPLALLDHVDKFPTQEMHMLLGGLMRSSFQS